MWLAVIFGMVSSCSLLLTVDMLSKDTHTHILISSWQYLRHLEYSENKCSRWHNHSQWCESLCIFCTCSLFVQMNKVIANLFKGSPIMLKMYFLSFSTLRRFLCMLKIWKVKKVQVRTNRSSSLPQRTQLLKRLISLYSMSLWHHSSCHRVTDLHKFQASG